MKIITEKGPRRVHVCTRCLRSGLVKKKQFKDGKKIGKILPYLLNDFGIDSAVTLKFIRKKWGEIFDFSITEHTFPKNLKDGILQVTVNSHTWLVQLSLLKDEFIKKTFSLWDKRCGILFWKNLQDSESKE